MTHAMTQTNQEMAAYFDRCADQGLMREFTEEERGKLDGLFAQWGLQPGERVLEPGCGSGRLTAELARAVGPQGEVVACDLSEKMLQIARDRRLPAQARFVQKSVVDLQCADDWFDAVICLNVFPHFAEPERTLREFARVLKPGGRLWVNHLMGSRRLSQLHRDAGREVSRHTLPLETQMRRLMNSAGFRIEHFIDCDEQYALGARLA